MSFGLSKIVEGADRGIQRNREIQRQKVKDAADAKAQERAEESHDVNIQRANQEISRFGIQAQREDELYARQQKDHQTSEMIKKGLLKFEVEGDPVGLIEAYNVGVPDGREISEWKVDDKGMYQLKFTDGEEQSYGRQELAAMGITLAQPGALEKFRQGQEKAKAEREKELRDEASEREHELKKIRAESSLDLERQLIVEDFKAGKREDLEITKADLNKDEGVKSKLKAADYNAIRSTLESAYGKLDPSGKYVFDGTNSEKYQRALAFAEKAFHKGLGHGEAALIGRQVVSGKITDKDALAMARKELKGSVDLGTKTGRQILNLRKKEIVEEANKAFKKAAKLGLFDDDTESNNGDEGDPIVEGYLN